MTYRSYRINCLSLCVSFFAAFLFCILFILSPAGYAEVTLDGTLGPQKTLTGPDYQINAEDGRIINHTNLFHSFGKFTIDTNESASFSGPDSISNIIGRVTGGTQSWIDGLIRSTIPDANLFLLNPSGILFGPNASLDVQGSFHVSTADFIRLGENGLFYSDPSQESILTVDPPASFGFLGDNPAGISVQESELQVPDGKTLSLIGGDIDIVGDGESSFASAELCAPSGRIHIASVASAGEVIANAPDKSPKLQVDSFDQLGDITISQGALIDTSGDSGGAVLIKGGRLMIGSSYIVSNTLGNFNGAAVGIDIDLKGDFIADASTLQTATVGQGASGAIRIASETLEMHDSSIEAFSYYGPGDGGDIEIKSDNLAVEDYSTIKSYTYRSPGKGGNIEINAGSLHLKEGGQIYVKTYGSGDSGDLSVAAKSINLSSTDNFSRPASLGATTASSSSGQGGDLRLTTDSLEVRDGAQIDITTFGAGDAGNLEITADTMLLSGINGYNAPAAIFARARGNRGGNAGQVHLTIGNLEVLDGGTISTSSFGYGNGGELIVNAERVYLSGANNAQSATGFFARGYYGDGGDIRINTDTLEVADGAALSCSSKRSGAGGAIDITANKVLLSGVNQLGNRAGIFSQSESVATGAAGDVRIEARELEVRDGAIVSVGAIGPGTSGNMEINAGSVLISGRQLDKSAMLTAGTQTVAKGGNIGISTNTIEVINGGTITVNTFGSGNAGVIDIAAKSVMVSGVDSGNAARIMSQNYYGSSGNAGDVRIVSDKIEVSDGADISVSTYGTGDGGSIEINAEDVFLDGGNNPEYGVGLYSDTASSGKAGDISLYTNKLEVIDGARISSSTSDIGYGGSIDINAEQIYLSGADNVQVPTGLLARTEGGGHGGSIFVTTEDLYVADGAAIDSSAFSSGDGGGIEVYAKDVMVSGTNSRHYRAAIAASTTGAETDSGKGGKIYLESETLQLQDKGFITTETLGPGDGGEIELVVSGLQILSEGEISSSSKGEGNSGNVLITAADTIRTSNGSITTSAEQAQGGNITISSRNMELLNNSVISAESSGEGNAGDIYLGAADSFLMRNSAVTTEAREADGGNIKVDAGYLVHLVDSEISASVGGGPDTTGGNVSIDPEYVILDNSRIIANAFEGRGGNIDIVSNVFLADPNSLVDASSSLGINGSVDIQAPITDLSGSIAPLAKDFRSVIALLRGSCMARIQKGKYSSFVVGARDGLPPEPGNVLPSPLLLQ